MYGAVGIVGCTPRSHPHHEYRYSPADVSGAVRNPSREVVDHRVQVSARPVEQTDDGGVDVPHLVGSRRSKAHLRLGRVHAEPGAAAPELPHQVSPGRGGRPDRAEPLRKDGERPGRDMPVLERGHHVLDCADLGWGQSMGRRVRTGRLIVKRTRVLQASPGMESTRGQPQEPQERLQRHTRTGTIHVSQDPNLGASVGQSLVRQRESRASTQGEGEPKECRELLDASPELQDFLPEFRFLQVRHMQADPDLRCLAEPPTGRRARNASSSSRGSSRLCEDCKLTVRWPSVFDETSVLGGIKVPFGGFAAFDTASAPRPDQLFSAAIKDAFGATLPIAVRFRFGSTINRSCLLNHLRWLTSRPQTGIESPPRGCE